MGNETDFRKHIGKRIKLARTKLHYTQEKLAEKTSLSSRYISQLERGLAFGSASTIITICKVLNISSEFLFHELIDSSDTMINDFIDDKFSQVYLQLDDRNRKIIHLLAIQLLKLQEEDKQKEA